jgi:DNA-directed RNA polymerase specialized sigma subunit
MRFGLGWTQRQIAAEIGLSQMQVSRLLTDYLRTIRELIDPAA